MTKERAKARAVINGKAVTRGLRDRDWRTADPSASLGMTERGGWLKGEGRLLKERAVAKGEGRLLKERTVAKGEDGC
jgi:hypothetical protein